MRILTASACRRKVPYSSWQSVGLRPLLCAEQMVGGAKLAVGATANLLIPPAPSPARLEHLLTGQWALHRRVREMERALRVQNEIHISNSSYKRVQKSDRHRRHHTAGPDLTKLVVPISASVQGLAVGETVILLRPPVLLVGVSTGMERGCQQNDGLADGYQVPSASAAPGMSELSAAQVEQFMAKGEGDAATLCRVSILCASETGAWGGGRRAESRGRGVSQARWLLMLSGRLIHNQASSYWKAASTRRSAGRGARRRG